MSATGGERGAGIGGGFEAVNGTLTISGGEVTAQGGRDGAGIGGGFEGAGGNITIDGHPTVIATRGLNALNDIGNGSGNNGTTTLRDPLNNQLVYIRLDIRYDVAGMPYVVVTAGADHTTNENGITGFFRKTTDSPVLTVRADEIGVEANISITSEEQSNRNTIDLAEYHPILTGLSLSAGALQPTFSSNQTLYDVNVANNITNIRVTPTVATEEISVTVWGNSVASGTLSQPISLAVGENTLPIVVVAKGGNQKTYTITITRSEPDNSPPSGGGGGGGEVTVPSTASVTMESNTNRDIAVIGLAASSIKTDGNRAFLTVASESITRGVASLQEGVTKGKKTSLAISIPQTGKPELEISFPDNLLKAVADGRIDNIEIRTEKGEIRFSPNAFGDKAKGKELTLWINTITVKELPSTAQPKLPEGAAVLEINAFLGGDKINKFAIPVVVTLPYSPKQETNNNFLTVYQIKDDGTVAALGGNYESEKGKMIFRAGTFGKTFVAVGTPRAFSDLETVGWAKEAIDIMSVKGYIAGRSETRYDPNANISRAEVTALMTRLLKLNETTESSKFTDVLPGSWYYQSVQAAYENGLITGRGQSKFDPEVAVTRAELAVIISQVLQNSNYNQNNSDILTQFSDWEDIPEWARSNAAITVGEGIIKGSNGYFYPDKNATRAEVAVMLNRLIDKIM